MAYSNPEIRKFSGLHLQANSFNVPDGALEEADNVVIAKDDRITKRRGFYEYNNPSSSQLKTLAYYEQHLLAIQGAKISRYTDAGVAPNLTGTPTDLTGESFTVTAPRISRTSEASQNLYFTADQGIMKIEAYNGTVFKAGIPSALDLNYTFWPRANSGYLKPGQHVGARVVFGRQDGNGNLLLGSPSDFLDVVNNNLANNVTWTSDGAGLVTVTSVAHGLSTGEAIFVSAATGGVTADAAKNVTTTGVDTFTFTPGPLSTNGTLSYGFLRYPRLEFSIPSELNTTNGYFVQVYRTDMVDLAVIPVDYKLIAQAKIATLPNDPHFQFDFPNFVGFYDDEILTLIQEGGSELYTNENTREGEIQANERPPLVDDLALYKGFSCYAKATTRHSFIFDVVDVDSAVINNGNHIEVVVGLVTRRYVARDGAGNENSSTTSVLVVGTTVTGTLTNHGLLNGDVIYVSNAKGGTIAPANYTVTAHTANDFTFTVTPAPGAVTSFDFFAVTNGATFPLFARGDLGLVSDDLETTAKGIVKAINRDSLSLIYAEYLPTIDDTPGKIRLFSKGFGLPIQVTAQNTTVGLAFFPQLTTVPADNQSTNEDLPNVIFVSKFSEPEAVPIVNRITVGSKNKAIIRVKALRDSLIVLKEDGVFRITGETPSSFNSTVLDSTVVCVAPSSVDVINNQIIFLSNQGICTVTENSVQIISRRIEDVIQPILTSSNIAAQTGAVAYESERLYILTTIGPNETAASVTYVFNVLNDTWTTWDNVLLKSGVIGSNDTLYIITTGNKLRKERKNQSKIDYCDQNYAVTVSTVAVDGMSALISSPSANPEVGDLILKDNIFSRIQSIAIVGALYRIGFERATNMAPSDALILYSSYTSRIRLAPFHAGLVGKSKQFAQMQVHMRNNTLSHLTISFVGSYFGGSESVDWRSQLVDLGWGFAPWGFFPWGQEDGINSPILSSFSPIIRIYVPRFQQRATFIQPILEHKQAGEAMDIQALSFAVRSYGERVTK